MATMNKIDMMNCCRGWHDFSDGATECHVCGAGEDEASSPNATGLVKHHGIVQPPSASMVAAADPVCAAAPSDSALRAKLQEAVDEWPKFDVDETAMPLPGCIPEDSAEVNGGDMVEWFGIWRAQVKELLAGK